MKSLNLIIACLIIHILLYGCIKKAVNMNCIPPLAKFNAIYIMNIDTSSVIDEFGAGSTTIKGITGTIIGELENKLIEGRKFTKIIPESSECTDEALRVESKLVQIKYIVKGSQHKITNDLSITRVKGKYEILVSTRLVSCRTGETLYLFETNDRDSDLYDLSKELGEDIASYINEKAGQCD